MKRMVEYLRPLLGRIITSMSVKFFATLMDLVLPWILAHMIDNVVPLKDIGLIAVWGGLMVVSAIVCVLGNVIANRSAAAVARDVTRAIRHDLFTKISYLSGSQIDEVTIPSLMARLTSDTYNIHRMVGMCQRMMVRAPLLLLGGILITLTLEPMLTLVLLATLPFITIVVFLVSRKGVPLYTQLQLSVDKLVRNVRENASGIRIIKALSKVEYEKERFDAVNREVVAKETAAGVTMAASNPLMNLFLNVGLTLVIITGAYRANMGLTSPGTILAFLSYFTIILNAMMAVTRIFVMYSRGSASANRIQEVLDLEEDLQLQASDHVDNGLHISFEDVSFSYHKDENAFGTYRNSVSQVSFGLKRGEKLGIIGATGCGKSTVLHLLMRLYDVGEGAIRINGDDIRSIPPEELHTMFGIAFQNDVLFADTISENIDFGRHLVQSQIRDAAEFAQAEEFVNSMEENYNYLLTSKGTNLSGGQKQRLLIARALAGRPEILILDDSSSALDYRTDAELRKALHNNFEDTTTIIVAQRISSIMYADHILVMDEGRVIGSGNHDHLMETCDVYREISESQMGGVGHAG